MADIVAAPLYDNGGAVFNVKHPTFGATGNGVTNDTTAILAAITAAQAVNGVVYVPPGTYKVTNLSISGTVTMCGAGDGSQLIVGANNAVICTVTGSNVVFRNLQLVGDGTTTSSSNGVGIFLAGAGLVCEDVLFTGFGFGGISGSASSTLQGPKIARCRFIGNGVSGGSSRDIAMGGAWQHSSITDCTFSTTYAASAIFFFELSSAVWYDVQIRGGSVDGYQTYGIVCTDESWDGSDRVYDILIDGVTVTNVQWEGIKCKVSRGVRITNCFLKNCSQVAENSVAGLYGSIFVNSLDRVVITGNIVIYSGCDAIRVGCGFQYPSWNPGGQACSQYTIANNIIENPGATQPTLGNGISAINPIKQLTISGNSIRGATLHGIQTSGNATLPQWDVGICNNTIVDNPTTSNAISVTYATTLRMDGNICQNSGVNIVDIENVNTVLIGSSDMALDPVTGPGARGYSFTTIDDLVFCGKAGNSVWPAWAISTVYAMGDRVNCNNGVYQCVVAGTSASTGSGPTGTRAVLDGTPPTRITWYYVGFYKGMTTGLSFAGTNGTVTIGDSADFKNLVGGPLGSAIPATYRRANIASGTATFVSAGTVTVSFPVAETDTGYKISLAPGANETFWWSNKTVNGFTLHSSNATSTASVDWEISR